MVDEHKSDNPCAREFHIDPTAAADGPYGGVIASGCHTFALGGHAMAMGYLSPESSLPSPGAEDLRWHAPVGSNDTLTWRATVLTARPSRSDPTRGIVRTRIEAIKQDESLALGMTAVHLIRRRPAANN